MAEVIAIFRDQLKDAKGNVIGYFKSKAEYETYVDSVVPGKEYSANYFSILASLPELKKHFQEEGYPEDANKRGSLSVEFFGRACQYK